MARGKKINNLTNKPRTATGVLPQAKTLKKIAPSVSGFLKYLQDPARMEFDSLRSSLLRQPDFSYLDKEKSLEDAFKGTSDIALMLWIAGYMHSLDNSLQENLYQLGHKYLLKVEPDIKNLGLVKGWDAVQVYPLDQAGLQQVRRVIVNMQHGEKPADEKIKKQYDYLLEAISQLSLLAQDFRQDLTMDSADQLAKIYDAVGLYKVQLASSPGPHLVLAKEARIFSDLVRYDLGPALFNKQNVSTNASGKI